MLLFYKQKEDAIVIIFEKERIISVLKFKKLRTAFRPKCQKYFYQNSYIRSR